MCVGIGLETASELARYGARVIMACRNVRKAEEVKREIISRLEARAKAEGPKQCDVEDLHTRLVVRQLDLSSFKSIRTFASEIQLTEPKIDVLVNNAGCDGLERPTYTEDGLEVTMGTNHYGPFLLTNLLLPVLQRSEPSRIVVLASVAYMLGRIDFSDRVGDKRYARLPFGLSTAYCNSKLANILFARQLALKLRNTAVTVTCVHPGPVGTNLLRNNGRWIRSVFELGKQLVLRSPLEGAQTSVYLAASQSPQAQLNGAYYVDCKPVWLLPFARDDATAKKLWEFSEQIVGLA